MNKVWTDRCTARPEGNVACCRGGEGGRGVSASGEGDPKAAKKAEEAQKGTMAWLRCGCSATSHSTSQKTKQKY